MSLDPAAAKALAALFPGVDLEALAGVLNKGQAPRLMDGALPRRGRRSVKRLFTIYDRMEFPKYARQSFPRMLYHPEGTLTRGPRSPMISVIIYNEEQETEYLENGWHDHPAKAMKAAGLIEDPRKLFGNSIMAKELQKENDALRAQLAEKSAA